MGKDRASLEGTALRFACVPKAESSTFDAHAASRQDNDARLYGSLAEAEAARARGERLLVVAGDGSVPNRDPYRAPAPVTAGGGLVVRREADATLLLLIFRRGAWDLPKGKLDRGEAVEACALREVREEVGIETLRILGPAGTTVHGYPEKKRYCVKTTWWYVMETPERRFTPEAREGIEAVEWVPWPEAVERLGYASLRRHLAGLTPPDVHAM